MLLKLCSEKYKKKIGSGSGQKIYPGLAGYQIVPIGTWKALVTPPAKNMGFLKSHMCLKQRRDS